MTSVLADDLLTLFKETYMPREDEIAMRDHVCNKLLDYLKRNYDSKVEICLFGSSRNGFTFRGSDLDICMTFDGNLTGEVKSYKLTRDCVCMFELAYLLGFLTL